MLAGTLFAPVLLALTGSFSTGELAAVAAASFLLPLLAVWLVMRGKMQRLQAETAAAAEKQRAEAEAALKAEQTRAAAQLAEVKKTLAETSAKLADTEQRFTTHREVADRRQTDASQQITRLEADLAAAREIAAQLVPTQSRIKDLEIALAAEQGRVKAQDQAIEATNARATDFEKRLAEAQNLVMKHKAEMLEAATELKKVRDEQAAYLAAGGPEAELAKAREAHQQAEAKIANLQRALKAAEARIEMVQKEFMNAVGVASAPMPGAAPASDKKVRDLEEKLAQLEAESRKRAREDGYKIAELEYRLSEAVEAATKATPPAIVPPKVATAVVEVPKVEEPTVELPKVASSASAEVPVMAAAQVEPLTETISSPPQA
jgi:DNA repair exonuclease SbcCD ATPase subunit